MEFKSFKHFPENVKKEIVTLKPIKVEKRKLYPLVEVLEIKEGKFNLLSVSPIALVVVEGDEKYLLSLDGNEPSPELLNLVNI
ncbi:MAG TPA: hypothetical protein VK444_00930 [Methanobacteriaceae archaeon]|nr:hypothetical protein [Methanobacteriaceae archaeon]